jgi:biopolymer transport protein ExbD
MKRRTRRGGGGFELNLTPLLDVVLQLITFFMMLIHFGTKLEGETKRVRLPVAAAVLPGGELGIDRLSAAIDARGRLLADDQAVDEAGAARWWDAQAKLRREGQELLSDRKRGPTGADFAPAGPAAELPTLVVIRADKDAPYGSVRKTLQAAQERGFAHFSLIVLTREPKS